MVRGSASRYHSAEHVVGPVVRYLGGIPVEGWCAPSAACWLIVGWRSDVGRGLATGQQPVDEIRRLATEWSGLAMTRAPYRGDLKTDCTNDWPKA